MGDNAAVRRPEEFASALARRFGLQVSRISSSSSRLPIEATDEDARLIASLSGYTMTSPERLWCLIEAVRAIEATGISGDFVECGVWRGGSVMAMAQQLVALGVTDRRVWLYDTFAGMTDPTEKDIDHAGQSAAELMRTTQVGDGDNVWAYASRPDVEANLALTRYPMEQFTLVEGDVAETLAEQAPAQVALLRLDTDWYASTYACLEVLYPRLMPGGICILDDYGHWDGARSAVDEYFIAHPPRPFFQPIDFSGRVLVKSR